MLILSRKIGEKIVIAGSITVAILDIRNGRVKLGITAPLEVSANREEVQKREEARK